MANAMTAFKVEERMMFCLSVVFLIRYVKLIDIYSGSKFDGSFVSSLTAWYHSRVYILLDTFDLRSLAPGLLIRRT